MIHYRFSTIIQLSEEINKYIFEEIYDGRFSKESRERESEKKNHVTLVIKTKDQSNILIFFVSILRLIVMALSKASNPNFSTELPLMSNETRL